MVPWGEIHVNMVGPWRLRNKSKFVFWAVTIINPVPGLLEIYRIKDVDGINATKAVEYSWLCRYPKPSRCVHDNGPGYLSHEFFMLMADAGIEDKPVSSLNPQSNGIIKQVHKTVGQVVRTLVATKLPKNKEEAGALMDEAIAFTIRATRLASHSQN